MSRLAIHLNDAGITLSDGERIVYREPGYAWLGDGVLTTGNEAFAHSRIDPRRIQHRFWSDLTTTPLADRRFSHLSAADLAINQLEHAWQATGGRAQIWSVNADGSAARALITCTSACTPQWNRR